MSSDTNSQKQPEDAFSKEELEAIQMHKYYLSEHAGYDVGEQFAREHWRLHQAQRWRHEQLRQDMEEQLREMRKYRWIESEKAKTDLGTEAELDWIRKYAVQWRKQRQQKQKPGNDSGPPDTTS